MGDGDRTRAINVEGSRTVFEAAVAAGVPRICHASITALAACNVAYDLLALLIAGARPAG